MKLPFVSCSQMSEFEVLGGGKTVKCIIFLLLCGRKAIGQGQNMAGDGWPINHEIQFQRRGIVPSPFEREEIFCCCNKVELN